MARSRTLAIILVGAVAMAAGIYMSMHRIEPFQQAADKRPSTRAATVLPGAKLLLPFSMHDHTGRPFSEKSLKGQWSFLSFGYTYCPDICPTTLATLARMDDRLKRDKLGTPYQVVFVSIDPARDTQERLKEYIPFFNASFLGVTGEDAELAGLTRQLGILYAKVESTESAMGYLMDHSASVVLIDPQGRFHALFSGPHDAAEMAEDFRKISGQD